jgi:uncharacterized surface protein with fasciclin (FAS1) repeats
VRKIQRLAAVGAMAALTVALGACSSSATPSSSSPTSAPAAAPTSAAAAASNGVTTPGDVFGAACSALPQGDMPGSLDAMGPQPVATAASTNPLLTTLVAAVGMVDGLGDTLNSAPAITVYAPVDDAFAAVKTAVGDQAFNALLADQAKLGALLSYHVSGTRYDKDGLVAAGSSTQLAGGTVKVAESGDTLTLTGGDGNTATVLCGNIPTSNATVFAIDKVLMPAAS